MKIEICYLCGKSLVGEINDDHVPPKQIYGKDMLRKENPNLLKFPVHKSCNESYRLDEEYFANTLAALAPESYGGKAFWNDLQAAARKGARRGLLMRIVKEFDERPNGLYLPNGKIVKRQDDKRIRRVAWKIVRGLYFDHKRKFIPEDTQYKFLEQWTPENGKSTFLPWFQGQKIYQRNKGTFEYIFLELPEIKWSNIWAFFLWDKILIVQAFQNPQNEQKTTPELSTIIISDVGDN